MSATTSDPAAKLVADAVRAAAARSTSDRRLYLRSYLGISLQEILNALLDDATAVAEIEGDGEAHELVAVSLGGSGVLVPYLVTGAGGDTPNSGSQGYSAYLRDHFA